MLYNINQRLLDMQESDYSNISYMATLHIVNKHSFTAEVPGNVMPHRQYDLPRPWGLPSLLYNGHRVIPGGKAAGAWC